jgi:acyl-CoA synthetase (AMP-forming)/AMP-acid ligase II
MALTEADVIDFCRERLAGYKVPRSIRFVDALPRNAAGKLLRAALRETFAAEGDETGGD